MFEELPFILGFLIFSIIISYLLFTYLRYPVIIIFVRIIAMIGIIFHELCHIIMCIITNTPIGEVRLLERLHFKDKEGNRGYAYGGRVGIKNTNELKFLQAVLVALAPLLISFWVFFLILEFLFSGLNIEAIYIFVSIIFLVSIIFAAAPSAVDLKQIPVAFQNDPNYSLYQIILLSMSICSVWIFSLVYPPIFFHEIIYYILIGGFYYLFKYAIKGMRHIVHSSSKSHVIKLVDKMPYREKLIINDIEMRLK